MIIIPLPHYDHLPQYFSGFEENQQRALTALVGILKLFVYRQYTLAILLFRSIQNKWILEDSNQIITDECFQATLSVSVTGSYTLSILVWLKLKTWLSVKKKNQIIIFVSSALSKKGINAVQRNSIESQNCCIKSGDRALLVLNRTSLNSINALLALSR